MTEQAEADELLRLAVAGWLKVHGREHPREIPGDLVVVAHFRSWESDETQVDDYEIIWPAGVSYHSALGLMHYAGDTFVQADEVEDDGDA